MCFTNTAWFWFFVLLFSFFFFFFLPVKMNNDTYQLANSFIVEQELLPLFCQDILDEELHKSSMGGSIDVSCPPRNQNFNKVWT